MKITTDFPLSTVFFKHWSPDDIEVGIVVAKAQLRRCEDGFWRAGIVPELCFEDSYVGSPETSPLAQEQDIAPGKIGTDVIIRATARTLDRVPMADWPVSVLVADRLRYDFHVRGPSSWTHHQVKGWQRRPPQAVSEVPLGYDLAYGGACLGANNELEVYQNNPAGIGFCTKQRLELRDDIPIAQIGSLAEFMNSDPLAEMTLHGVSPIAKSWLPRRSEAGTFNEQWEKTRHPRMPLDYSMKFWNAAHIPLQMDPPLHGDEVISVAGISHSSAVTEVSLPRLTCAVALQGEEGHHCPMVLDTVDLDLRDENHFAHTATLIWRAVIDRPERFSSGQVVGQRI